MLCSIICRQNKKLLDIFHNLTFRSFYESLFLSRCHNLKRNQAKGGEYILVHVYNYKFPKTGVFLQRFSMPIVNNLTDNLEHNGHRVMSSVILPEHQYFSIFRFLVVSNRNEHVISAVLYIRRIHSVKLFPVQHYRIRWVGKINHIQPFFAFKEKINFHKLELFQVHQHTVDLCWDTKCKKRTCVRFPIYLSNLYDI